MKMKFSTEQEKIIKDNFNNYDFNKFREIYFPNVKRKTLYKKCVKLGLIKTKKNDFYVWTQEQDNLLKINYLKKSYEEIKNLLGDNKITIGMISHRIKKIGLKVDRKNKFFKKNEKKVFFNESFFEIPNKINSYWAGFIAADGNISNNRPTLSIQISDKDYTHLEVFCNLINFTGKISRYERKNKIKMCSSSFNSFKLIKDLESNFFITPKKTFTLKFPIHLNEENKKAFIMGYIDGDGSISKRTGYNHFCISVIGRECFLREIIYFFNKILPEEIRTKINPSKDKNIYRAHFGKELSNFVIKDFISLGCPHLKRKWERL